MLTWGWHALIRAPIVACLTTHAITLTSHASHKLAEKGSLQINHVEPTLFGKSLVGTASCRLIRTLRQLCGAACYRQRRDDTILSKLMHTLQHVCRVWGTASQSSTQISSSATVAQTQAGRTSLVVRAVAAPSRHTKARKLQVAPERQPRAENVGLDSASHFYVDHTCIGAVPDKLTSRLPRESV